jgi:sigma-B regulation protein RsbU (phosphoserine phosphatase)
VGAATVRANLSRRLLLWAGVPATVLFGGVVAIASMRSHQRLIDETEQVARGLADYHAAQIEQQLSRASKIPEDLVLTLERGLLTSPTELEGYLREVIVRNPEIYGSCLAFEPGTFAGKDAYGPYWYRKDGEPAYDELGKPDYNYLDPKWEWYERPKREGHAVWTEPYFDDGGGNTIMTTYSAPFYRDGHTFWGIATIDIAMSQLMEKAQRLRVGETGYTFIVSQKGNYVAFPDPARIMKANIGVTNPDLGEMMMAGKRGFVRKMEPLHGRAAWIAFAPIQAGEFSLGIVYPEAEVLAAAKWLQYELMAAGAVGLLALFGALFLVARSISEPITSLAAAAQRVAAGELDQELRIVTRTEEVQHLATAFRKMTRDLKMRMDELRYTTIVKERIEGELSAARSIQISLVAKTFPAFPDRHEIDLHAIIKPARAVGGDFYDFHFVDSERLCLVAADVAGKGVPAALYMSVSKTLLRANTELAGSPPELLAKVNNDLCDQSSDSGMFVSLALGLLNVRNGEFQLGNAGHPAPLRLSQSGEVESLKSPPGVALGAWRDLPYSTTTHQLEPGDTLLFFTDGVTEALDDHGQFYTIGRLRDLFSGLKHEPVERITRAVMRDVRAFAGQQEQADDLTLLAIRWNGGATNPKS